MKIEEMKPEVRALVERGGVTLEEVKALRCNSWEWEALQAAMTDEALVSCARGAKANASRMVGTAATTYDEACVHRYLPLVIERLEKANALVAEWKAFGEKATRELDGASTEVLHLRALVGELDGARERLREFDARKAAGKEGAG